MTATDALTPKFVVFALPLAMHMTSGACSALSLPWSRIVTLCSVQDRDALLTFYDFPAQHWDHLHSTDEMDKRFLHYRDDDCENCCKSILLFGRAADHSSVPATDHSAAARRGGQGWPHFAATARLGLDRPEHGGTLHGTGLARLEVAVSCDYVCWARATSWRSVTRRLQASQDCLFCLGRTEAPAPVFGRRAFHCDMNRS